MRQLLLAVFLSAAFVRPARCEGPAPGGASGPAPGGASGPAPAPALSAAEVEERLRPIPVFVLTDGSGSPLVANDAFGVYTDPAEADAFLKVLREKKPDLAAKVRVTTIPLSEIVRLTGPGTELHPEFIGSAAEREAATHVKAAGSPGKAPVFVVRAGTAYLTVTHADRAYIPVFFAKKQADDVVTRFGARDGQEPAHVEAAALESVLDTIIMSDDPDAKKLSLVPSDAMLAAIGAPKKSAADAAPPAK